MHHREIPQFAAIPAGQAAADELWAAVKARGRPELLSTAVAERLDHPDLDGDQAAERAEELHVAANEARRAALSPTPDEDAPDHGPREVEVALEALRGLLADLRSGRRPAPYDAGSLRLFADELLAFLQRASSSGRAALMGVGRVARRSLASPYATKNETIKSAIVATPARPHTLITTRCALAVGPAIGSLP